MISRALILSICTLSLGAEDPANSVFRVNVDMVLLTFTVTDAKGRYVNGLKPSDVSIKEDGEPQKIVAFSEGTETSLQLTGIPADTFAGTKVFILFDTSNWMYTGFPYAADAIADFVRTLDRTDSIAVYKFSRNLYRAVPLTPSRETAVSGVRSAVAGDDTALYNALLLTLRDAAKTIGKKAVVVFSNGPDNASIIPPEDVAELAQSTGTVIYMISTQQAQLEPISTAVFERMTAATGGKAYFARNWNDEKRAFASIRDDLAHLYSLSYYPQQNPNRGWRSITVKLNSEGLKKCHVRTRNGYRLQPSRIARAEVTAEGESR